MTITSRQNPLVVRFRDAARGDGGPILLDGAHLVADAVGARLTIRLAVVTPASREKDDVSELLAALSRMQVEVATVSAPVMDAMSPVRSSSSIVALADRPAIGDGQLYAGEAPLVVVAIDVQDPGNVGAIVRVAEAAGATGVIAAAASANPWGWKALRGSMGSALRLPLAVQRDAGAAIAEARQHGCRIMAAVPRDGRSMFQVDYAGPVAILIGGEGTGLPASLSAGADERVTVPMQPAVESLNAAVTAALIVYEAFRQRSAGSPSGSY